MILETELASKIISDTKKMINEDIIITNTSAIIIASTNNERIGDFHEGAEKTIKDKKIITITKKDEKLMKGVRAGINLPIIINENVIGMIGITGPPAKTKPFASIIKKMTELLIRENIFIKEMDWKERVFEKFIFDWLNSNYLSEEFIRKSEVLGINVYSKKRCILLSVDTVLNSQYISLQLKSWLELESIGSAIIWGDNQILIITEVTKREHIDLITSRISNYTSKGLNTNVLIGIGVIVGDDLQESYKTAEKALKVTTLLNNILFYDDLLLELFLGDLKDDVKSFYLEQTIGQIKKDPVLLKTLKIYLHNNLNLKATAELLHIHINTLHYRLQKITKLTALNPKKTEAITLFHIAVQLLDDDTNK